MKPYRHILTLLIAINSGAALAQQQHSTAEIFLEFDHYRPQMKVGLYIELEPGWHTYWTNAGETGMGPTFDIAGAKPSEIFAPAPKRFSTPTAESFGYAHEVLFYRTIEFTASPHEPLLIQADWLVCKEICIPNSKQFTITIPTAGTQSEPNAIFANFVYPSKNTNLHASLNLQTKMLVVTNVPTTKHVDVFPADPMDYTYIKPIARNFQNSTLELTFSETPENAPGKFLLATYDSHGLVDTAAWLDANITTATNTPAPAPNNEKSLPLVLFLALIGGFLLNLMPCVFPVVSIKFFKIASFSQKQRKDLLYSNLTYSLGVIVSFIALAFTLVFLRSLGQQLGWGFQLQSPMSIALLITLFYIIGLNFLGVFDIASLPMPSWINQKIYRNGLLGDFFTGVFTTAVATPCTAPFMAASIGYALTQNAWIIFATFFMLGLGLSAPYIVLATFPAIANKLPKPGPWMNIVREALALPMFLTCAWLIWVYSKLTSHSALLYLLIGLVGIEFAFRSLRWTKNKFLAIALIGLALWMIFWPHHIKTQTLNYNWIVFSPATVERLQEDNQWIFVDFTADWCLTCKANEALVLGNSAVQARIDEHNIQMVKADWTQKDPVISQELKKYGRVGVPFYLLYKPGVSTPQVLPTLLTPSIFLQAAEKTQ